MSSLAILLGFEYPKGIRLQGIISDLYIAYKFFREQGYEVRILTDIVNPNLQDIQASFDKAKVSADILTFHAHARQSGELQIVSEWWEVLTFMEDLPNNDRIAVYYSGHGEPGCFVTNQSGMRVHDLSVLTILRKKTERLLWVNDCCSSSNLSLPYTYLRENGRYQKNSGAPLVRKTVLMLTATKSLEKTDAMMHGSLFTGKLFLLLEANSSLKHLSQEIPYLLVHSSMPDIFDLRQWFV